MRAVVTRVWARLTLVQHSLEHKAFEVKIHVQRMLLRYGCNLKRAPKPHLVEPDHCDHPRYFLGL